jgi:hypothetical protein
LEFSVGQEELEQVFLPVLRFPPSISFPLYCSITDLSITEGVQTATDSVVK